jgi:hypothetical protein
VDVKSIAFMGSLFLFGTVIMVLSLSALAVTALLL